MDIFRRQVLVLKHKVWLRIEFESDLYVMSHYENKDKCTAAYLLLARYSMA